jgi:hypothetical protein
LAGVSARILTERDNWQMTALERKPMPKCGVCGWSFGGWAMTKHAETPCGEDDRKAEARPYTPEIDDLIKMEEEASE